MKPNFHLAAAVNALLGFDKSRYRDLCPAPSAYVHGVIDALYDIALKENSWSASDIAYFNVEVHRIFSAAMEAIADDISMDVIFEMRCIEYDS